MDEHNHDHDHSGHENNLIEGEKSLPLSKKDLELLQTMSLEERRAWAQEQIFKLKLRLHRLAPLANETPKEHRVRKNAQKRRRKLLRAK